MNNDGEKIAILKRHGWKTTISGDATLLRNTDYSQFWLTPYGAWLDHVKAYPLAEMELLAEICHDEQ